MAFIYKKKNSGNNMLFYIILSAMEYRIIKNHRRYNLLITISSKKSHGR